MLLSPLLQTCAVLLLLIHCICVGDDEHPPSVNDIEHLSKDSETSPVDEANSDKEITALTNEIQRAWRKRLSSIKSAHFAIETTHICKPYFAARKMSSPTEMATLVALPDEEIKQLQSAPLITYVGKAELLVDGMRVRFTQSGQRLRGFPSRIENLFRLSVTDGVVSKAFFDKSESRSYPSGFILNTTKCGSILYSYMLPVRAWAGQGRDDFCKEISRTPFGIKTIQNTGLDRIVSLNNGSGVGRFRADRDFSLVKWDGNGELGETSIEIENRRDEATGLWVPSRWQTIVYMQDGSIGQSSISQVTHYEINPEFSDTDFQFEFPPGSRVSDSRPTADGYDEKRGTSSYVIKPNGEK
jgi:hypothetical protein